VCAGCPSRIRTSVHGSKVRCPTTRRRGNDPSSPQRREWSGRRDSNPRPSHWQCDALPTEPLPHRSTFSGAESQIRTGDTALFRRVLYQLSYLGPTPAATRPYAPTAARIPSPAEGRNEAPRGRLTGGCRGVGLVRPDPYGTQYGGPQLSYLTVPSGILTSKKATFVKLVPVRSAPVRSTTKRVALVKLARVKLAPLK
jgi:hypothetical protein